MSSMRCAVPPNITFRGEVATTMEEARNLIPTEGKDNKPFAVASEVQLKGRGSTGRQWVSPKGNLYFTVAIPQEGQFVSPDVVPVLPLVCGLACQRAVQEVAVEPSVQKLVFTKWPNDLIFSRKKMGGSIVEATESHFLLGIGVNVHLPPNVEDKGREAACLDEVLAAAGKPTCTPEALAVVIWGHLFHILTTCSREQVVQGFDSAMDKTLEMFRRKDGGRDPTPLMPVSLSSWGHLTVRRPDGSTEELCADYLF